MIRVACRSCGRLTLALVDEREAAALAVEVEHNAGCAFLTALEAGRNPSDNAIDVRWVAEASA